MKENVKSIIIFVLVLVIVIGGNSYWKYHKGVNKVVNYSIHLNLNATQQQLINLRDELKKYDNKQMSNEEFQNIIHEPSRDYFLYADYSIKFDHLGKNLPYVDSSDLYDYIISLSGTELSAEEVEYHKNNLMKIIKLWAPLNFDIDDNYLQPAPQLKNFIDESNRLANEGFKRLEEKQ